MKKLSLFTFCILVSCGALAEAKNIKQQAIKDVVKSNDTTMYSKYLRCYPLDKDKKNSCIQELSDKYVSQKNKKNNEYIQEFTYEAEKQGFANFLKKHEKDCDKVDEGPLFNENKSVYDVKCRNGKSFEMHFDYKNMTWLT